LIVQVPSAAAVGTRTVHIRAVALPLKTYYRMDASLSDSNSMLWPIGEVLFPLRLHHSNLGVFGWLETPEGRLFLPLRVTSDGSTSGRERIEIVVRTTTGIDRLLWRSAEETTSTRPTDWQPLKSDFSAGRLATISLPEDRAGILLVDVAGKLSGSEDWARLTLRVLRTPK
jgi:hypothetical protein